jgi:hypothetical protein
VDEQGFVVHLKAIVDVPFGSFDCAVWNFLDHELFCNLHGILDGRNRAQKTLVAFVLSLFRLRHI